MLKVTERNDSPQARVEFDMQLPFVLSLGVEPGAGESLKWYCKDGDKAHLEIWMNRAGVIHRVALIYFFNQESIADSDEDDHGPRAPTSGRVPVCDVSAWDDPKVVKNFHQLIEQRRLALHLGREFVSLRFQSICQPKEWVVNRVCRFGINAEGRLCQVDLVGLASEDLARIRKALAYEPT